MKLHSIQLTEFHCYSTSQLSSTVDNTMTDTSLSATLEATHVSPVPVVVPSGRSLPTTVSRSYKILGVLTDAVCQIYVDRIVILVSQLEGSRIGNFLLCQAVKSPVDPKAVDWQVSTVLGDREDALLGVYARRVTQRLLELNIVPSSSGGDTLEVLMGISLHPEKGKDPEMFQKIVQVLVGLIQEAWQIASGGQEHWEGLD